MLDKVLMTLFCQTPSCVCPLCYKDSKFYLTEEIPEPCNYCYKCEECGCIIELDKLGVSNRKGRVLREGKK